MTGMTKVAREISERRIGQIRKKIKARQIDAVLVTKLKNIAYLSGFTGTYANLMISQDDCWLVTDFRYTAQASSQAPSCKIIESRGDMINKLYRILKSDGLKTIGLEHEWISYEYYMKCKSIFKGIEIITVKDLAENLRLIKDEHELKDIKRTAQLADKAFSHILQYIRPGISEFELAAEIEYNIRTNGGSGVSFDVIAASGERAALPHGVASSKKLKSGEPLILDFGAVFNGYCSDITRTVFVGKPDAEMLKIYGIVLDAQNKGIESAVAGKSGKEIDSVVRKIITDAGYGSNFGHATGHGVGLEVHENPRLSRSAGLRMKDGMVVTVEPGIYLNNKGGVRIEDMVAINGDHPAVLTSSAKALTIL